MPYVTVSAEIRPDLLQSAEGRWRAIVEARPDLAPAIDLQRGLLTLAPEQREVLLLVALEDMTYADVSRALGIPIGTVMSRLSRGREKLRRAMHGETPRVDLKVVQ